MPKVSQFKQLTDANKGKPLQPKIEPLWEGPSGKGSNGGITQSMLQSFVNCRERFRVKYVLGLQSPDGFSHRMEYGNMWHACEEAHAAEGDFTIPLKAYAAMLIAKYPMSRDQIIHWHRVCKSQFPHYVAWWSQHPDTTTREPIFQEYTFDTPYKLPSGRVVRLRGKFDSVDSIVERKQRLVFLQENKAKGDVAEAVIANQQRFDLQTGVYLVALREELPKEKIGGVRYNVIRRPLSGGRGTIKQTKNETVDEYYTRLEQYFIDDGEYFFKRWRVDIYANDIEKYERRFLIPILEQLCDWWEYIGYCEYDPWSKSQIDCEYGDHPYSIHWQHPYGVYNPVNESQATDADEFIESGTTIGLQRAERLFRELV